MKGKVSEIPSALTREEWRSRVSCGLLTQPLTEVQKWYVAVYSRMRGVAATRTCSDAFSSACHDLVYVRESSQTQHAQHTPHPGQRPGSVMTRATHLRPQLTGARVAGEKGQQLTSGWSSPDTLVSEEQSSSLSPVTRSVSFCLCRGASGRALGTVGWGSGVCGLEKGQERTPPARAPGSQLCLSSFVYFHFLFLKLGYLAGLSVTFLKELPFVFINSTFLTLLICAFVFISSSFW